MRRDDGHMVVWKLLPLWLIKRLWGSDTGAEKIMMDEQECEELKNVYERKLAHCLSFCLYKPLTVNPGES